MKSNFYPSYIPKKWIHYTRHKKSRIRKKYQNRILRYVRQHERDAETSLFLLYNTQSRLGMSTQELLKAAEGFGRIITNIPPVYIGDTLLSGVPELDAVPILPDPYPQEELEKLNEAFQQLADALAETFKPVFDWLTKLARKLAKWVRDVVDRIWCNNRHWWYMAEHHKKRRIRKKYRTKIKRMARDRARKLLHSLGCDTPEEQDDTEASDDEEVP